MSVLDVCLVRSRGPAGEPVLRFGVQVLDDYLDFVAGRCRPNTGARHGLRPAGLLHRRHHGAGGGDIA
jgi:hypothetical protein